jgi:hypothetical protein
MKKLAMIALSAMVPVISSAYYMQSGYSVTTVVTPQVVYTQPMAPVVYVNQAPTVVYATPVYAMPVVPMYNQPMNKPHKPKKEKRKKCQPSVAQ